ncbi:MAG: hypothetical protein DMF97_16595 [Acidobacteria bacterium]|nr:MAG: hypothetical protein DMF97_16595 [Acidobacteriota bacterium]
MVNWYIFLGLAIMIVSEAATVAGIEPFASWNTPIAWTGFIIFADAVVYRARGNSWMRSSPREFAALCLVSIPLWLVFESFNLVLRNWHYVGLPENAVLRTFGYAWSFATIWPAIFEGAELIGVWRTGQAGWAGQAGGAGQVTAEPLLASQITHPAHPADPAHRGLAVSTIGALMLASPFLVAPAVARYLAAPVWLGFVLLLDPINAVRGEESLQRGWRAGQFNRTINLVLSGFLCGGLWELWNYWAHAKWHYTVPIMENLKVFEMPLPGYLGFPPFALECFTMYVFLRSLIGRSGRPIAL